MAEFSMRRADFMMFLAYASDIATGHTSDFALRSCVLAMRIGELVGSSEQERRNAYHQSLLRYVGCNADTHLLAATFGDEIALRRDLVGMDMGDRVQLGSVFVKAFTRHYAGLAPAALEKAIQDGLARAAAASRLILTAHCEVAQRIGERLGLSEEIRANLGQIYERWDGKGLPRGRTGDAVLPAVRLVTLAQDAIALSDASGIEEMARVIASRADGAYEARLALAVSAHASSLMAGIGATVDREEILRLEPDPPVTLNEAACDEAFLTIADVIDMRLPFTHGHSRAVADLAEAAGQTVGLPSADVRALRWSGHVHDLGELAVPVSTWMRNGPLTVRERDAAQLHAYHSERALAAFGRSGAPMAALVLRHHERLDGSGYHRKVGASDLSLAARILAAAERFQTAREPRPHRTALSNEAAASMLRAEVRAGRLCSVAVEAVLSAAGQPSRRAPLRPLSGMTPREVEVLRLIAAGLTVKETANTLDISPKTVDHHIQSIYARIGVSTRAAAALYAVEHGVLKAGETSS
jgi:HD-GYP domain-containing protein (c-di-GMP phosphodiesterase class II)